jgi:hypothetical protein
MDRVGKMDKTGQAGEDARRAGSADSAEREIWGVENFKYEETV